ncbi:hypothetical protein Tco_0603792 [Tanacetum coccineum]
MDMIYASRISSTLLMCLTALSVGPPEKEILRNSLRSCPLISNVALSRQVNLLHVLFWSRASLLEVWYVIGVATLRALVRAGDQTSGDARGTGGRAGSGGGRNRVVLVIRVDWFKIDGQGGSRWSGVTQVGDQGRGQGNGRNQNGDAVNDNIQGDMESVQDTMWVRDSTEVKSLLRSFVGKAPLWWENSLIHTRGREGAIGHGLGDFRLLT